MSGERTGTVFKIQRHGLHDGPGIRTLVFLKGCPLRCWWCFNPESQRESPEILHYPEKCIGCGACAAVCPVPGAVSMTAGRAVHDPAACVHCGRCVTACPASAFIETGRTMSSAEVAAAVLRDKVFYDTSGGGVTLSGGEVTRQADFAVEVLSLCGQAGVHTAVETCGHCSWETLSKILERTDHVLYDLKSIDSGKHRLFTGVGNERILDNLKRLAGSGKSFTVRMPVVPGCNDSADDSARTADFLGGLGGKIEVDLLPYELFGIPKYARLGRPYRLEGAAPPTDESLAAMIAIFRSAGIGAKIGG